MNRRTFLTRGAGAALGVAGGGMLLHALAQEGNPSAGMIDQPELRRQVRDLLRRSVTLICDSQNGEGGWRYQPVRADADLSVTICQIMALRAARNAGIAVQKNVVDRCTDYVKACQDQN